MESKLIGNLKLKGIRDEDLFVELLLLVAANGTFFTTTKRKKNYFSYFNRICPRMA